MKQQTYLGWIVTNRNRFASATDTLNTAGLVHAQIDSAFGTGQSSQASIGTSAHEQASTDDTVGMTLVRKSKA